MRKITLAPKNELPLEDVHNNKPIFAKKNGKLTGMVVQESSDNTKYHDQWIIKVGGQCGADGYHRTRKACLQSGMQWGYEYFIEE